MIPATVAFIKNDHVRDIVEKDGKDQLHQPVSSCMAQIPSIGEI